MRTRLVAGSVVAIVAVTIGPFATSVADAGSAPSAALLGRLNPVWPKNAAREEAAFVADINAVRASRGLPALRVRADLTRRARLWATTMAAAQRIRHSRLSAGVTANWHKLGENVGMGPSERLLHAAFIASGSHFANLVDPAFKYVGVGVVAADDLLFVSELFMQPRSITSGRAAGLSRRRTAATLIQRVQPQPALRVSTGKPCVLLRPLS
jgi:uncharacterized protein YkwD